MKGKIIQFLKVPYIVIQIFEENKEIHSIQPILSVVVEIDPEIFYLSENLLILRISEVFPDLQWLNQVLYSWQFSRVLCELLQ